MSRIKRRIPLAPAARALFLTATLTFGVHRCAIAQESPTAAQDSAASAHDVAAEHREGWIVGPLVGLPGEGSEAAYPLLTLGVGVTRLVPNRVGLDFAIGTAPYPIAFGVIPVAARLGPSIPLPLGRDAFLIPSVGVSALAIAGVEAGPPVVGWYWGAAAVVAYGPVGLRAGVTVHRSFDANESPVWLAEVGVMSVPLPRRAR
jgi:hypothetical protein